MIKTDDLKAKSADELKKLLLEKRKEQFNLRFQHSGGQLENTSQMRKIRREIAQVKTFINKQSEKAA